jgi:hypothetical protein
MFFLLSFPPPTNFSVLLYERLLLISYREIMATYLGPLTTTFKPPSSCLDGNTLYRDVASTAVKLLDAPECFPTNYVATGYYSPGFFCPAGYQASTLSDGIETTLNCCPK